MSDTQLSQAEIDALLGNSTLAEEPVLGEFDKDLLGEIGNISFGSAATSLSSLLHQRVEITTPHVTLFNQKELPNEFPNSYAIVAVSFTEGLAGVNALAIEVDDAKIIADLMMGGSGENISIELNELHLSAVGEAMNQMMGNAATSMSTFFNRAINISPPQVEVIESVTAEKMGLGAPEWLVSVAFQLKVGTLIDSKIMQLIPLDFAQEMSSILMQGELDSSSGLKPEDTSMLETGTANLSMPASDTTMAPAGHTAVAIPASSIPSPSVTQKPVFTDLSSRDVLGQKEQEPRNLSLLLDVPLTVTVELGRTRKPIRDVLNLGPGSVLELDKLAGEPVDILVNGKRIAMGEVVVIDENFGVRVRDIVSQGQRIKELQ